MAKMLRIVFFSIGIIVAIFFTVGHLTVFTKWRSGLALAGIGAAVLVVVLGALICAIQLVKKKDPAERRPVFVLKLVVAALGLAVICFVILRIAVTVMHSLENRQHAAALATNSNSDNPQIPPNDDLSFIYLVMLDDDNPRLDYEGEGIKRMVKVQKEKKKSGSFVCELIILKIPEGQTYVLGGQNDSSENYLIHFSCTVQRTSNDGIHVRGVVDSKIFGKIQFAKMVENDKKGSGDFPELLFKPGKTSVDFDGKVVGWFEKEK
ncbi:MAG: hypothetical protein V1809_09975 [Planctomycetota bacterium]